MPYISNLSNLSALLDRLVIENIKKYDLRRSTTMEAAAREHKINSLDVTIEQLKAEITNLFTETLQTESYHYESEQRTYDRASEKAS